MILEQGGVSVGIWVRNGVQVRGMEIMIINILNNTRMKDLYRYIFTKAYFFCITVFKEKEFPQYFASGVVTLALVTQIVIILELIEYLSFPTRVNIFGEYHGYFAVFCWGVVLLYINNANPELKNNKKSLLNP
nr:hypothetical protein [uncultured Marinifilum sp.]